MPIRGVEYKPNYALHPGSTLSEKLEELELSPQDFAKQANIEEHIVVGIVEEKGMITSDIAEALHKALGIPAHFWMNRQQRYSEFIAQQQLTKATF